MDYNALMEQMAKARQEVGQRYADAPNIESKARESLFGNDAVLKGLQTNETAKLQELYGHDKVLADRYANPQSEGYLDDPYAREKARATRFQGTAGELNTIQQQVQQRRDVIGDALERSLKLINYGLEAKKLEAAGLQDEFDNKMKLDDFLQKKSQAGKATEGDKAAQAHAELQNDLAKRMTLPAAIAKYSHIIDPSEIFVAYTAQNTLQGQKATKTQYGQPKETAEQLFRLGILKTPTYDPNPSSGGDGGDFNFDSITNAPTKSGSAQKSDPLKIR